MKIKDLFKNLKKKKENETNAENPLGKILTIIKLKIIMLKENSKKDIFL